MEWFANLLRHYPELAIFLTLAFGFWIGKFKIKKFTLGTVTSVLLVGVLIGQLHIDIGAPLKSVFFLMFLFAVGYSVGPQFFRGLKKGRIATGLVCRRDVPVLPAGPVYAGKDHGLFCRRGCRSVGWFADDIRCARCGRRYD